MHGAEAMGETGVVGSRIDHIGHAHLLDAAQTLEIGVLNDVEMQFIGYAHKTVNRVVEDFLLVDFVGHIPVFGPQIYQKLFNGQPKKGWGKTVPKKCILDHYRAFCFLDINRVDVDEKASVTQYSQK